MRPENKRMQEYLKANEIKAIPQCQKDGSLKGSWRLYGLVGKAPDGTPIYQNWWDNFELQNKLNSLGFTDLWGKQLSNISGNGGVFSVFVRGHNELLTEAPKIEISVPYTSRETRRDIRMNRAAEANMRITKRNGSPMYY
jgi:hypothetical protein